MVRKMKSMDGNNAAAHVSYAFSEVAAIYPITPSSVMAELTDSWSATGLKNIFGENVRVTEMQSEAGAAGTVHGSLAAGALTTTYTASQGLLLMIPNMYKIAAEQLPCVFHVSARTVSTHALNIFGDHSDVMACRQTGFAMLCETNPQEVMDLSPVAHLAAIEGKVPFLNFFDGFRTSHEIQKVAVWDFADLKEMCNMQAVEEFRQHALNPEHPAARGCHENGDIFFQHREACNQYYNALPAVVEKYMGKVNEKLGTDYKLFNYYGAADADRVIVAMGSICDVAEEVIDYLNAHGEKVGLVKVRLYRPFRADKLIAAIPATCKKIAVLDRTREPGAIGEPLYLDVVSAIASSGRAIKVCGGRYGLGSKDVIPEDIMAVYEHLKEETPRHNFTLSIKDDVTNLSLAPLPVPEIPSKLVSCKFWGFGSDGTVGANKSAIKIIGDHTDLYAQGYFAYDSKKSGGVTISHLRFGPDPIRKPYLIRKADYIACHRPSYIYKYDLLRGFKPGGIFLLNSPWRKEDLDRVLPAAMKRKLAALKAKFYIIDAFEIAKNIGLGGRINMIMQSAFFHLTHIIPDADAVKYLKDSNEKSYGRKGQNVVDMNNKAVDAGMEGIVEVEVPSEWEHATTGGSIAKVSRPDFVKNVCDVMNRQEGDDLPVSTWKGIEDGTFPSGTSQYERPSAAIMIPEWIPENCIGCNQCGVVCPHAAIRPFLVTEDEAANAPEGFIVKDFRGPVKGLKYRIVVDPEDCYGCGICANTCPAPKKALVMQPAETELPKQNLWDYAKSLPARDNPLGKKNLRSAMFEPTYFEFSGACAGCGETPYINMVTRLFGDRMMISNATGCSSIYGASSPSMPYTKNSKGQGPAWANSLFEDNAEYGLGMHLGEAKLRSRLTEKLEALLPVAEGDVKTAMEEWLAKKDLGEGTRGRADKLDAALTAAVSAHPEYKELLDLKDHFVKKSQWIFGGDGWAYDIGFGGLDHVLASGEDVNVMVFDTEMYSNTGGQASKASNIGEVCQFAAAGKEISKKSLSEIAMTYGYIYVAQIALGANMNQAVKAIAEAEAYPGPSLIIGYAPCELHGVKGGMTNCQNEMKKAVEAGYWNLFTFNPANKAQGKNPFTLTSKAVDAEKYQALLANETRYSRLTRAFPDRAKELFARNQQVANDRYEHLTRLVELYK